jgi:hypothetical protein
MKKKTTRRRDPNKIKILNLAEGYVQMNILTENLAGSSALEFVGGEVLPGVSSGGGISLIEIVKRPELLGVIGERASDPGRLVNVAVQSSLAAIGFRFGKRALRRNINMVNRMVFKPLALGVKL